MIRNGFFLVLLLLLAAFADRPLRAEASVAEPDAAGSEEDEEDEADDEGGAAGELVAETSAGARGLGGWIDLRPSWNSAKGTVHSENEVGIEYQLTRPFALGYTQEFRSNLLRGGIDGTRTGFELQMGDGYLWGEWSDLLAGGGGPFTLNWEPRLYLPTARTESAAGLVLATRQYLKLNLSLGPVLSLFLWEIPIAYVYSAPGYEGEEEPIANRAFENRIELGPTLSLWDGKLSIKVPLVLQSQLHRSYQTEALNDGRWVHDLWIYPQAMYQVAERTGVGVAFYSDVLMDDTLGRGQLGSGFQSGIVQLLFQQVL